MSARVSSFHNNNVFTAGDIPLSSREVDERSSESKGGKWATCMSLYARFPVYLAVVCFNAVFQGMIVNGFISVSISSIEKRFNLTSVKSGIFSATYDVAVAAVLIPLAIYSKKVNKSFVIGVGMVIVGFGAICITLPQFTEGNYSVGELHSDHCDPSREGDCTEQSVSSFAFPILVASQILVGIGAAPLFTYGYSCIDEFDSHKRTGRNMAVFLGVSTVGPAVGFIGGGMLLNVWGDIGKTEYEKLGVAGKEDPRWYGAWWIGFTVAGIACVIAALPMLFFPRRLHDTDERRKDDVALTHYKLDVDYSGHKWEYLKTFQLFLCNPTCMSLVGMQTFLSLVMNGYITFIPKLFENLFGFTASWAAQMTGMIVVPMGILGNFTGAFLSSRTNHSFILMMKTVLALNLLATLLSGAMLLQCEDRQIADLNAPINTSAHGDGCNANCNCERIFNPVCDETTATSYFSPCHAGCKAPSNYLTAVVWPECTCTSPAKVSKGWCKVDCTRTQIVFFTLFALMTATVFANGPILQNASLRVVSFEHRDQFICFGWFFMRVFGSIPGAILFGWLIDTACIHWMNDCGDSQKCVLYKKENLAIYVFCITVIVNIGVLITQITAWKSYTPVPGADDKDRRIAREERLNESRSPSFRESQH